MKTRSTQRPTESSTDTPKETSAVASLVPSTNPPLLFILPENTSSEARIVTLPNPASSTPNRYYFCPDQGIHEFTKVAAPKKTHRSWLIAPDKINAEQSEQESPLSEGYTIENADLFVATPIDPLFVLLPALIPAPDSHEQLFLSIDDHLDHLIENSKHLSRLLRSEKLRQSFEQRAEVVCDNVDLGHEKMYRLSNAKLLAELVEKARRMTSNGLPASVENHFVQEALRVPVTIVQQASISESQEEATPAQSEGASTPSLSTEPSQASQFSIQTEATSINSQSFDTSAPDDVVNLLRLRTALNLMLSAYIPQALHQPLKAFLSSSTSPLDFKPLDAHLEEITIKKRQAHALRSLSDNISRKRSGVVDDEAEEIRAEKRRKKEEEDNKKKNTSRGVKQLSKVNTTGMMKLSSFFTKGPAKSK